MNRFFITCFGLFCLFSSLSLTALPQSATAPEPKLLAPGQTVEAEIAAGEKHVYHLPPEADRFLQVRLSAPGLKYSFRLLAPDGKRLQARDNFTGSGPFEDISAVTSAPATYQIEVQSFRNQPARRYQLTLVEWRTPRGQDRLVGEMYEKFFEGLFAMREDRYQDARAAYDRAFVLGQIVHGLNDQWNAFVLTQRSIAEKEMDDLPRAAQSLEQALRIYEQLPFDTRAATTMMNLGEIFNERGEYQRALGVFEQALKVEEKAAGDRSVNLAFLMLSLGRAHFALSEFDQAHRAAERGLALAEKAFGVGDPHTVAYLRLLGLSAQAKQEWEKADQLFRNSLALNEKGKGGEVVSPIWLLNDLAQLERDRGRYEDSRRLYRRLQPLIEQNGSWRYRTREQFSWAVTEAAAGNYQAALALLKSATMNVADSMNLNLSYGSEAQKLTYLNTLTEYSDFAISLHAQNLPASDDAQKLAASAILQFKGRVQEALADNLALVRTRLEPDKQTLLARWQAATARLARLTIDATSEPLTEELKQKIAALTAEREQLETDLTKNSAGAYAVARLVSLNELQAVIPAKAALLEFAVYRPFNPQAPTYGERAGAPRYVVYVIRREGDIGWYDLGDAAALNAAITQWRAALRDPKRTDLTPTAQVMEEKLLQPLRPLLGDARHLLIAPDGALNLIPFEALTDKRGKYLVEQYDISYLVSGRDLLRMSQPRPAGNAPWVFADPLFGAPTAAQKPQAKAASEVIALQRKRATVTTGRDLSQVYFAPLVATLREARAIQGLFKEANVLTGAQATEAKLKQAAAPRLLHIATHGFFLDDTAKKTTGIANPLLRSGLALAGANLRAKSSDGEDGILTALEAAGLNLWGTQLVTLSACDTGLGEVRNGEGVYGLRRAFTLAGAETLMMSLWPVSDTVTRELMTAYYTRLQQGQGRGAALRQTQLQMLQRADRRHPFYWASFIQAGEWGNLAGRR